MSAYQYIVERQAQVPVQLFCQALRVSPGAYYAWRRQAAAPEPGWQKAIRQAFTRHSGRYGTRRLRAELPAEGHAVARTSASAVHWPCKACAPSSSARSCHSPPTRTRPCEPPQPLTGLTSPHRPELSLGDITYLPRQGGGWLYLASWLDRCSRKVLGWDVREFMHEDLVSEALR